MDCSPPGSSVHEILQEEDWSGLPSPSSADLASQGIEPTSPALARRILYQWASRDKELNILIIHIHVLSILPLSLLSSLSLTHTLDNESWDSVYYLSCYFLCFHTHVSTHIHMWTISFLVCFCQILKSKSSLFIYKGLPLNGNFQNLKEYKCHLE